MEKTYENLKLLVVEDNPGDFVLIEEHLRDSFISPDILHATTLARTLELLRESQPPDILLLDLQLPDASGKELIVDVLGETGGIPVIVLTGYADKNFGLEAIGLGAADFILKDEITPTTLFKSITYNLERKKFNSQLAASEKKYHDLFDLSPLPMWVYDLENYEFLNVNLAAVRHYGYSEEEFLSMTIKDIRPPEAIPQMEKEVALSRNKDEHYYEGYSKHRKKNGELIDVKVKSNIIQFNGRKAEIVLAIDITAELRKERQLLRQSKLIKATSEVNSALLKTGDWKKALNKTFRIVGEAVDADRVYYFENHPHPETGDPSASQRIEWSRNNAKPQLDNPELQNIPFEQIEDFILPLSRGDRFEAVVSGMKPGITKEVLLSQDIRSILVIPVFIRGQFQGFMGFDDCRREKTWEKSEIQFLETLTANVAGVIEKKEMVDELRDSEEKFRAMVQGGSDLIALLDEEANYRYVSPSSETILGIKPEEFIGKNAFDFIHPDDEERIAESLVQIRDKKMLELEPFRFKNGRGEWRWIETKLTNFLDNPVIGGLVANSRDVTESILKNRELQESLELYDIVAEATSDTLWDLDLEADVMHYNRNIHTMFGYNKKEVKKMSSWWKKKIHPDDLDKVQAKLDEVFTKNVKRFQLEYRFRAKDKSYKYIYDRAFVINNSAGKAVRIIGAMQDITRQKEEEARLRIQESVIKNATDSIMVTEAADGDHNAGKIIFVNRALCDMTGYSYEEVVGKTPKIFQGPETGREELDQLRRSVRKGKACQIEVINYKKDGTAFWNNISVAPVSDEKGNTTHWISIQRDVTEMRSHIERLEKYNAQMRDIAWVQSHIVRAPLARIMALIYLIESGDTGEKSLDELLKHISKSARELDSIIKGIVKKTEKLDE